MSHFRHDVLPRPFGGAREHGVAEGGAGRFAPIERRQEARRRMHERGPVPDREAENPPLVHMRMIEVNRVDRPPATHFGRVAVVEVRAAVQVLQVLRIRVRRKAAPLGPVEPQPRQVRLYLVRPEDVGPNSRC